MYIFGGWVSQAGMKGKETLTAGGSVARSCPTFLASQVKKFGQLLKKFGQLLK